MLSRYRIVRGRRPADDPLPEGLRQDTRKHTSHPLAPTAKMVFRYLAAPSDDNWESFAASYRELLTERHRKDPGPFDRLAREARSQDVYLGCNCPTRKQPDVMRCHTVLALEFMKLRYPDLEVRLPEPP